MGTTTRQRRGEDPTMGRARAVVERWWSLCEAGRLDETAQRCQPDVEVTMPGGGTVVRESVDTATIRDGRIAPWRTSFDQMAFLAQFGPLPEPATA
jgi:hypothetical protein